MNVRFYLSRFEEGAAVFVASHSDNGSAAVLRHRHVRYHRELLEAQSTLTMAAVPGDGPFKGYLVQVLQDISTGRICATSLDCFDGLQVAATASDFDTLEAASPRGLASGDSQADDDAFLEQSLNAGRAITTNQMIVATDELDAAGRLQTDRIVACFSDGASHIWEHAGVTTSWLNVNNHGRVSVEMKVQPVARVEPGEVLSLVSRVAGHQGRTFRLAHTLCSLKDGRPVARGEACCLVMNLETRRAVPLPESFTNYMADQSL